MPSLRSKARGNIKRGGTPPLAATIAAKKGRLTMALVLDEVWGVNYSFVDNNDKSATVSISLPGTLAFADAQTAAAAIGTALDTISNATLVRYTFLRSYVETAPAAPPAESEVERKLSLVLASSYPTTKVSLQIPSPVFTLETDNTDIVDPGDAQLAGLISALITGGVGPGNGITTYRGDDVTGLETAQIIHRYRRPKK